jgi:hypothetical protein
VHYTNIIHCNHNNEMSVIPRKKIYILFSVILLIVVLALVRYLSTYQLDPRDNSASVDCDYFVATSGNNTSNGSISSPWKTIQYAIDNVSENKTICVRGGEYKEAVDFKTKNNLTIINYQNEKPVINGDMQLPEANCREKHKSCVSWCYTNRVGTPPSGCFACGNMGDKTPPGRLPDGTCKPGPATSGGASCSRRGLVSFGGSQNNTIAGFEIKESNGRGISMGRDSKNNTIKNINVHDTYNEGIITYFSENFMIDNVKVSDAKASYALDCFIGGNGLNISDTNGGVINNSIVTRSYGEGLAIDKSDNITLTNNVIYDNFHVNLHIHTSDHAKVNGNLIYCSENAPWPLQKRNLGIVLADEVKASLGSYGNNREIVNNIVVGCSTGIALRWQRTDNEEGTSRLENDLFANNTVIGTRPRPASPGAEELEACFDFAFSGRSATNSKLINNLSVSDCSDLGGTLQNAGGLQKSNNVFLPFTSKENIFNNAEGIQLSQWPPGQLGATSGINMIISNPLAINDNHLTPDIDINNYRIKNTADQVIDKGIESDKFTNDFFNITRPIGNKWDVGAIEFGGVYHTSTPTPIQSATPTQTPGASLTPTLTRTPGPSITPSTTPTPSNAQTPVPSATPTPPVTGNICGKADIDGDGKFSIADFAEFAKSYGTGKNTCADKDVEYGSCGGRDVNRDGKLNIADFGAAGIGFAQRYYPKTSCAL